MIDIKKKKSNSAYKFVNEQVYMGSFSLALAGIPWVIMSEVALSNCDLNHEIKIEI